MPCINLPLFLFLDSIVSTSISLFASFFSSSNFCRSLSRLSPLERLIPLLDLSLRDAASLVKRFLYQRIQCTLKILKRTLAPLSDTFVLCYVPLSSSQEYLLENKIWMNAFHRIRETKKNCYCALDRS